jgi:hypothetical protein
MHTMVDPTKPISEIDAIRQQGILSSLAGFPILLVFGFVWITAGALSYVVPRDVASCVYLVLGIPGMPIALALERHVGRTHVPQTDFEAWARLVAGSTEPQVAFRKEVRIEVYDAHGRLAMAYASIGAGPRTTWRSMVSRSARSAQSSSP